MSVISTVLTRSDPFFCSAGAITRTLIGVEVIASPDATRCVRCKPSSASVSAAITMKTFSLCCVPTGTSAVGSTRYVPIGNSIDKWMDFEKVSRFAMRTGSVTVSPRSTSTWWSVSRRIFGESSCGQVSEGTSVIGCVIVLVDPSLSTTISRSYFPGASKESRR